MTLFQLLHKYQTTFLRYRAALLAGILALAATNLLGIAIPWQIKSAVDLTQQIFTAKPSPITTHALWDSFYQHLWIILGLATLALISRILSRQWLLGAGRRVEFDLRNQIYQHLLGMPTTYFAAHPPGELMSRMTSDVDATKYLTGGGIMLGVNTLLVYALAIPMLLIINWPLACVTFLLYPAVIFVMTRVSKRVREGYRQSQEILADISTLAQENLNGMMVIQSYAKEEAEAERFAGVGNRYFEVYTALIHERILLFMVLAALSGLSTLIVLLMGGGQVIAKQLDWGGFVAFTMYLEYLAWPTMALGWTISIFQQGTASLERIDQVLSAQSTIQSPVAAHNTSHSATHPPHQAGVLEIRDLSFSYHNPYMAPQPGESLPLTAPIAAIPVLRQISLTIQPGETIALVGPVGSGKSTLLRLLPRLLDTPAHQIFLNQQDITTLPLSELRAQMVFMPQTNFLFSSTIHQNIAFGQNTTSDQAADALIHAAETASVHLDILDLPQQYQTLVGERGLMLSGGQRQRVSLARAILVDAPILVLDDPVSNVDAETERNIVSALKARNVFHHKTTLIATHRFSLLNLCNRVVLMDAGHIIAVGTPAELLATQPLYQKLHRLQELREQLGNWELDPSAQADLPLTEAGGKA